MGSLSHLVYTAKPFHLVTIVQSTLLISPEQIDQGTGSSRYTLLKAASLLLFVSLIIRLVIYTLQLQVPSGAFPFSMIYLRTSLTAFNLESSTRIILETIDIVEISVTGISGLFHDGSNNNESIQQ